MKYTLTIKQGDKEVYTFDFPTFMQFIFDNIGIVENGKYFTAHWGPDAAEYVSLKTALRALRLREQGFKGWPRRGRWDCV